MKKIIKHYQTILQAEQFVITGSLAMSFMGLVESKKVGDIDIILVNPTAETVELLKRLSESQPARTKVSEYKGESMFIFQHDEVKIDVFIEKIKIETELIVDGFSISPINKIIEAKKGHNRPKDWIQLMKLSKVFFNKNDFNKYVESF